MKRLLQFEASEQFDLFLFIKKSTRSLATSGQPFLTMVLQDQSGELEGRLWDVSPEGERDFVSEQIVRVLGEIQLYKGKKQIRIKAIRLKTAQEMIQVSDLLPKAPIEKEQLTERIASYVQQIDNVNIQKITRQLLNKYSEEFLEYPAATKNHHEFLSGLAFHVVSMLDLAKAIVELYPTLDKNLLYAGIILHDLGKVLELSGPAAATYTVKGNLLGHISIMVTEIEKMADELSIQSEEVLLLQHLVLSHHGKPEWGSPKAPMLKEAEILHYIDNIDAKMNMMDRALENTKPGDFSERIYALDNRSFYKPQQEK